MASDKRTENSLELVADGWRKGEEIVGDSTAQMWNGGKWKNKNE